MDFRAKSRALAIAGIFVSIGTGNLGCSAPPGTTVGNEPSGSEPGKKGRRVSIDPTAPGATILCSSEQRGTKLWVLSAMNHKLATYPEFARAIDLELVSDCESATRYWDGYVAYSAEHPDFDADEPVPPSSELEPTAPSEPPPTLDVSKIAGGENGIVNHPIVDLEFITCSTLGCPRADDSWIIQRDPPDENAPHDVRRKKFHCTGTFIAKNWIVTAAHCITPVAIDSCMEHGDTLDECVPTWVTWGEWTIRGTRPNIPGTTELTVWARAYVMPGWVGRSLSDNDLTCEDENCFDAALSANDDIALLYVPMRYDRSLFPNVENDAAKRLSFGEPESIWQLAFYGWGDPAGTDSGGNAVRVLRRGRGFFDQFTVRERRIDIRATTANPFPCSGDSGGPMMHTGLQLDTNGGIQSNLEAVVGITSAVFPDCAEVPLPGTNVTWWSSRVDHPAHKQFILDSMRRYPEWKNFSCASRGLVGIEAEECWGPPCTIDGRPQDGGCPLPTQTCVRPGRTVGAEKMTCGTCDGTPQQGSCNCIVGQCLPK